MKELLKRLTEAYGPSGREGPVRRLIQEEIEPYVDSMEVDALGNLIARKGSGDKRVMLTAHMDQIGLVVTEADKKGFLRVHNVGYLRRPYALGCLVRFENGLRGVVAREVERDDPADMSLGKLFVDIGASSREEALERVSIGDMAVLEPQWAELGNGCVAAGALDDRAGCAMLIQTLKELGPCPCQVVAAFTTQEEVGLRGAKAAGYQVDPALCLALDVTLTGDTPKAERLPIGLGKGIAIKVMDSCVICAPQLVAQLEQTAQQAGIAWQREVLTHGGTDAGAVHVSRAGVPSGALSIPCRYTHSACEVVSLADIQAGVDLLTAWLSQGQR